MMTAGSLVQAAPPPAPDREGLRTRLAACAICHGDRGQGIDVEGGDVYPRLAGQLDMYLHQQMRNLKSAARTGIPPVTIMHRLLESLPDNYLQVIAEYYHTATPPYPPRAENHDAQRAQGREIVQNGIPAADVRPCTDCHGGYLEGKLPGTPKLAGQYASYLVIQFEHWAQGARHDPLHEHVAKTLTQQQVSAVAEYLSILRPVDRQNAVGVIPSMATETPPPDFVRQLSRGEYLVRLGDCRGCHTRPGSTAFSGGVPIQTPFGVIYSTNITPDKNTGIGDWSFDDFYRALHEGIGKEGEYLYPAFPFPSFTGLSREDVLAIWTYLGTVQPANQTSTEPELRWPYSMRNTAMAVWRRFYFTPNDFQTDAAQSPQWNRGAYLVQALTHCGACHTPRNRLGATLDAHELAGGTVDIDGWHAPNLTRNRYAGIDTWSDDALMNFLTTGRSERGDALGPMRDVVHNSLQYLNPDDGAAIVTYLKAVPASGPAAPTPRRASSDTTLTSTAAADDDDDDDDERAARTGARQRIESASQPTRRTPPGAALYRQHCADCHDDAGRAKHDAYPSLVGSHAVTAPGADNLLLMILRGGFQASTDARPYPYSMPPFGFRLSDEEIAAIANYVRNSWSPEPLPTVWPREVARLR